jgi:hypothetical protein
MQTSWATGISKFTSKCSLLTRHPTCPTLPVSASCPRGTQEVSAQWQGVQALRNGFASHVRAMAPVLVLLRSQ